MDNLEQVILVDELDNVLGSMEKLRAHQSGVLHRAFSVFLFDEKGNMLLQKRAKEKYHSPGLWTNTCCSHPRPGESTLEAAKRRLVEEMGIVTNIKPAFNFIYKEVLDQNLTEHEFDHVFIGTYNGIISPNSIEVCDYLYIGIDEINHKMKTSEEEFTVWFKIAYNRVMQWYQMNIVNL
jgi:isopentenyl-diphosphate delta-isomerase